jgi:hypothetical protein
MYSAGARFKFWLWPAILTAVYRTSHQPRQTHAGILPILSYDRFLTNPFQFINHLITRHYMVSILIGSLNNQLQEKQNKPH